MNNRFIKADHSLLKQLIDILKKSPADTMTGELVAGLTDISEGRADSLTIGISEPDNAVQTDEIAVDKLKIYRKNRRVTMDGREVSLTPKEFDILWFLAENRGEVFTKEQIYKAVWSENYLLDDSNIMAFIRKLRKKIEPDPDAPRYILTIWGIGYKFTDTL